jgi:hypothetical protein
MLGRFTVRPSDDGSGTFGVWDGAVNGWRANGLGSDAEAHRVATELDVQYDAHGPRPADAIRRVEPAERVQRAQWQEVELDVWIRDGGRWLGRIRDHDGSLSWVPGSELRQIDDTP